MANPNTNRQPQNPAEQAAVDNWKELYRTIQHDELHPGTPRPNDRFGVKEHFDNNQSDELWEESRWDEICAAFLVGQGIPLERAEYLSLYLHYHFFG